MIQSMFGSLNVGVPNNIVAYWKGNSDPNLYLQDSSPNGRDLTKVGAPTGTTNSVSTLYNASDEFALLGMPASTPPNNTLVCTSVNQIWPLPTGSITCLVKFISGTSTPTNETLFRVQNTAGNLRFLLQLRPATKSLRFFSNTGTNAGGGTIDLQGPANIIQTGQTHAITVSWNAFAATNKVNLYVDGVFATGSLAVNYTAMTSSAFVSGIYGTSTVAAEMLNNSYLGPILISNSSGVTTRIPSNTRQFP